MTVFNVKVSETTFKATVVDKNKVNIKTVTDIRIYGAKNFGPVVGTPVDPQFTRVQETRNYDITSLYTGNVDGYILNIVAVSSDTSKVTVSIVTDRGTTNLKMAGHSVGSSTVTVTATNLPNLPVSFSITVWCGAVADGNLYITNTVSKKIFVTSKTGTLVKTFDYTDIDSDIGRLDDINISFLNGDFWAPDIGVGEKIMYRFDKDGVKVSEWDFSSVGNAAVRAVCEDVDETLWLALVGDNTIFNRTSLGAAISDFETDPGLTQMHAICTDYRGNLYMADQNTNFTAKYSISSESIVSSFNNDLINDNAKIVGLSYSTLTETLWVVDDGGGATQKKVHNIDLSGNIISSFRLDSLESPFNSSGITISE